MFANVSSQRARRIAMRGIKLDEDLDPCFIVYVFQYIIHEAIEIKVTFLFILIGER